MNCQHLIGIFLVIGSLVVAALTPIEAVFQAFDVYGGPTEENRKKVFGTLRKFQIASIILGAAGTILLAY